MSITVHNVHKRFGDFVALGGVSVVSGEISGQTETLPLFVSQQFEQFNLAGAYVASILLALLALSTLLLMNLLKRKEGS